MGRPKKIRATAEAVTEAIAAAVPKEAKKVPVYVMGSHDPLTYISASGLDIKFSMLDPAKIDPETALPFVQSVTYKEREEGVEGVLTTIIFTQATKLLIGRDLKLTASLEDGRKLEMVIETIQSVKRSGESSIDDILVQEDLFFTADKIIPWHEVKE